MGVVVVVLKNKNLLASKALKEIFFTLNCHIYIIAVSSPVQVQHNASLSVFLKLAKYTLFVLINTTQFDTLDLL